MNNSICPTIQELEKIYDHIAKINGLDKIAKRPLITIQTQGTKKSTLGWHWKNKWKYGKKSISEINICAERLSSEVIETLIHEMIHYHNTCLDIRDCNEHQYHNKNFKERAESYGLNVEKSGRNGWAYTSLSHSLEKQLLSIKINLSVFKLYRQKNVGIKSPTKMIKYTCGCTIVRCATELNAICDTCKDKFIKG